MDERRAVEVLRTVRSVFDNIPAPCEEREALDHAIATIELVAGAEIADVGNDGKNGGESALLSAATRAGYYSGVPLRLVPWQ